MLASNNTCMFFKETHKDTLTRARTGVIHTDHGDIETPVFMPVGTQATVKSLDPTDLEHLDAHIILANTYHLHLRPGENLIAQFGGLHKFMGWNRPILTDSGGFQVFSLGAQKEQGIKGAEHNTDSNQTIKLPFGRSPKEGQLNNDQGKLVSIDEEGVTFRSYINGSKHRFTPESAIDIQHKLGADIIMAFDECTPDDAPIEYAREAMERTHRWATRSLEKHQQYNNITIGQPNYKKFLFGIIQGGQHRDLREESARFISSLPFDGIAIGGESIGYNMSITKDILDWVVPIIGNERPRYTMGLGFSPLDLFDAVEHGADMFDCVAPTRIARNGTLYIRPLHCHTPSNVAKNPISSPTIPGSPITSGMTTNKYRINITNAVFCEDKDPIDSSCTCYTCTHHTRAYLHHLFNAQELLAYRLATIHNVHFFLNLMKEIREAINQNRFLELKEKWTK